MKTITIQLADLSRLVKKAEKEIRTGQREIQCDGHGSLYLAVPHFARGSHYVVMDYLTDNYEEVAKRFRQRYEVDLVLPGMNTKVENLDLGQAARLESGAVVVVGGCWYCGRRDHTNIRTGRDVSVGQGTTCEIVTLTVKEA